MASTTEIRAIIKLLVEGGHIPKEVAEQLKVVGKGGKQAQEELSGVGRSAKELSSILQQYLGAAALGGLIKSGVAEFAQLDRQFSSLGRTMNRIGLDGAADLARARTELEALAMSGGPLVSQTLPAMQKFVTMTRDTDKALAAVKLASDVSESGITDFGSAAAGVASLLQGRVKVAATQFGIDLTDINGKAKTNAELIREIEKTYGGLGDAFDDAANQIDTLSAQWEKLKQTIGAGFAPALGFINTALFQIIGTVKDLGEVWGLVFNGIIALTRNTGSGIAAAFDFKTLFSDPGKYAENMKAEFSKNVAGMGDAWKTFTEGIAANHTQAAATVGDTTKGMAGLIQQATKATAEEDAKTAAAAAQKRQEIEHKAAQDSLQAQIQAAKEGSHERLDLEMQLLDEQEQAAVEAAQRTGANVDKIRSGFEVQRIVKGREFAKAAADADYEAESTRLRAVADLMTEGSEERLAAELSLLDREKDHQLKNYKGTVDGKRAIEAAFQATRAGLIKSYDKQTSEESLDVYRAQIEAQAELDAATSVLRLQEAEAGNSSLLEAKQAQLQAEYDAELDILAIENEAAINSAEERGESVDSVNQRFINRRIAAEERFAAASKAIAKDDADAKKFAAMDIASASIGFARAAFGETKAVRIAEVVMDTAGAVMNVWDKWAAYPPVAAALSALAVATGAAQIAKIASASPGTGSVGASPSAGASAGGAAHAAEGAVVERKPGGKLPEGFKAKGTDTEPYMLAPGEIVAPADESADVLAGRSVLMAPGAVPKGTPSKRIIGGRLAVVSAKHAAAAKSATPMPSSSRGGVVPAKRAAAGAVVPGIGGMISRAGAWFRKAAQPVLETPEDARDARDEASRVAQRDDARSRFKLGGAYGAFDARPPQIGGSKFSSALLPQLGAASLGGTAAARPQSDPALAKIADKLEAIADRPAASAEPAAVDQSLHVHGNVYGGDAGARELSRIVKRGERLDSNRVIG